MRRNGYEVYENGMDNIMQNNTRLGKVEVQEDRENKLCLPTTMKKCTDRDTVSKSNKGRVRKFKGNGKGRSKGRGRGRGREDKGRGLKGKGIVRGW